MSSLRALSGRTRQTGEIVVTRCIVRKRMMDGMPMEPLFRLLTTENFTGTVTLGVYRGGVRTISVEDRQEIDG